MDETPLLSPRYVSATTPLIFEVPSTGELDHEEDKILNWEACKHEAIRCDPFFQVLDPWAIPGGGADGGVPCKP